MKKKLSILFVLCLITIMGLAQDHLKIKSVFDKYGKQDGSVLVQLSTDILSQGSRIKFYKSLIADYSIEKETDAIAALTNDINKGVKISEMKKDGKIESGTYYIKSQNANNGYEYILYKNKSKKITVVYMQGNFPPQQLDSELKKLKDLFIYVNNKRIKLQ